MTGFKPLSTALTVLWGISLLLTGAGCTSDAPNSLGTPLVDDEVDVVLTPLGVTEVEAYIGKTVTDPDVPHGRQEVLYMGSQGGTTSSALLNFDFSDIYSDSLPPEAFTSDNIVSVDLRLLMLDYYAKLNQEEIEEGTKSLESIYEVYRLEAPFDSTAYPAAEPVHDALDMNINPVPDISSEPHIPLAKVFFLNWVETGGQQGLLVRRGTGSESGLVGYSARDMAHAGSALEELAEGTLVGPVLKVKFIDPDTTVSFPTYADVATFHELADATTDPVAGFMMRTCQRSYPAIRFDFSALPEDVYINRAILSVTNDTSSSFGNLESIVVSELPTDQFGVPGDSMPLADLDDWTYLVTGMTSLDPTLHAELQFNVTSAVQRIVNSVYEGDRGFILTAGEDFFPNYNITATDPDFYFTQFNFFGTAAGDTLRPHLRITYSSLDELTGGGE